MNRREFSISLQNRLALTYAFFICAALLALTVIINIFTGIVFNSLVKTNITKKSAEIVRSVGDQYNPLSRSFDSLALEAMGMYFVHEGYIVTVEDEAGAAVWDARSCDMQECKAVLSGIAERMDGRFGFQGGLRTERYPVQYAGNTVASVTIETYGPFFYSETEGAFLTSINRLLVTATVVLTLASILISIMLSTAIARPVNRSAEAARQIALSHRGGAAAEIPLIRIDERYRTRELADLARAINSLSAELEERERRQKRLTSDIAHELRTPLACLQGDIEAMIDGVYKPDKEHLESCHEEIIRLTGLVQDLNTLTALEWENMTFNKTDFDLADLLRITAEQFRAAALEKGLEIKLILVESPVTADWDRLKQVFINLLSNAVKYTDSGGITISVKKASVSGAQWEVSIADTGVGIQAEDLRHVFERFFRSDKSRSRGTGGTGIGLAITAAIVRSHGGKILAESNGEGTSFRILL